MSASGAPSDNTTMTAVLKQLRDQGYREDFLIRSGGTLQCGACRAQIVPRDAAVESICRLEGASDPADMAAVLALVCPACSSRGTTVVRYGPEAEPDEASVLLAVEDRRRAD